MACVYNNNRPNNTLADGRIFLDVYEMRASFPLGFWQMTEGWLCMVFLPACPGHHTCMGCGVLHFCGGVFDTTDSFPLGALGSRLLNKMVVTAPPQTARLFVCCHCALQLQLRIVFMGVLPAGIL